MKKNHKNILFAGLLAALIVVGVNQNSPRLDDRELGIGEYNEQAHFSSPRLDDRELGIGEYNEQAHFNSPRPDERELGIGQYNEQA